MSAPPLRDEYGRFIRDNAKRATELRDAIEAAVGKFYAVKLDYERRLRNLRAWLALVLIADAAVIGIVLYKYLGWF